MKTTTGVFGAGTQQSNSLVAAELKHPEISSVLIQQYPRYALTYLLERTGRHADVKVAGDKSFEWKVLGRTGVKAVVITGFTTIDANASAATIAVKFTQGELSKFDVVMDSAGNVGQVTEELGALGTDGLVGGTGDDADTGFSYNISFSAGHADIVAGGTLGRIGSAFGEGSKGLDVGEGTNYPDTYKNWLTINRRKISITGGALTDVTWIENNGSKLWYFTAEKLFTDEFMYQLELQRWFGKTNYDSTTATGFKAGDSALMGDGILAQIAGSVSQNYDTALTEDTLAKFISELSRNAKSPEGNEWVVFTGTEGRYQFHKAMKDISVGETAATGGSMQSMKTGSDVSLGVNYSSYNVLGNKMTVAYCPVFDDVNAHGADANGNMSGKMVFLDFSSIDGVPNVQLVAKGADGVNRNYIKKYIPGMISPYDQKSMLAANGDDAFVCQIMSESGIIVRNPLSCGVLHKVDA